MDRQGKGVGSGGNEPDISLALVLGFLIKWTIVLCVACILLGFIIWMVTPLITQASDLLGSIGFSSYSGHGVYSLAVLCVIIIGIIAAIKAFRR